MFKKKDKKIDASLNMGILKRIWREHTKKYIWALIGAMIITSLTALTEAYSVSLLKPIFDNGFIDRDNKILAVLCAQVVGLYFIKGWFYFSQTLILSHISTKTVQSIQQRVFTHLISLDMGYFNKHSSGQMLARIINDCNAITNIAINFITHIFKDLITCISMFGLMMFYSWKMCLVIFLFFPIGAVAIGIINRRVKSISFSDTQQSANFVNQISESLQNVKIIKSYCMEKFETSRIKGILNNMFSLSMKRVKNTAVATPVIESLSGFILSGIIIFGGFQIANGNLTTGGFVTFLGAWVSVYKPLKSLINFRVQLQTAMVSAERVYEIIDTKPSINDIENAIDLNTVHGDIEFKDVCFEYEKGKPILKNINMTIPAGKTVALVGASGGGKTTIVNLIPRFFEPTSGQILIDGKDIRTLSQHSLRENTSLVSQEVILFDDTIRNNIAYGKGEQGYKTVSDDEIISASKSANAYDFIMAMNEGYQTKIGEKGVRLSGGQKQRISIARAIIKNAPILLLDEATSALDTESEFEVQTALDNLMKNRTTIVIAHRLSTIKNADMIYVIEKGSIIEQGNHETLLAKNGEYAKLYNMQFKKSKQDSKEV
ncbi:MAG: ATP-binding cassette domain-containing protein [Alphaproteobacteria bacterium]|nr:ATP-binding cassette domain-containing protein [Alphaproteobacteria bacterium]